ncbi:cytochrome c biogenesis protein ResB [Terribacillus saccharophilus]|uniref:Cytochrome C biogenesis protein n=1 Tax=Terribacillus saccharophilus TaxID=361277 RepID=A0ABX4H349_9BACI|nr:cytochrome c biogenesis protein ResB [Terribacillus saccharophilus]PAD37107.1 cytochrome C biogenesis protein [Terribacillus saccharophilus]PAD97416.1 cytochrome C biogenesis protein [Terribacillus saccharophilus]PAE01464.1 cytochrome C biogenesis protein [Terribacillus saccharophilus]
MEPIICECGHFNPNGTVLCESCGKQIDKSDNQKSFDMRYEGSSRRSKTYKKTLIDKIWNFFSSVKVGIWIIGLILVASIIGTILPQQMYIPSSVSPSVYYSEQYGFFGQLYYQLGFHNLYGSWWYFLLLAALGVSLVVASLDRFIPLYRALKNQGVTKNERFLQSQRLFSKTNRLENNAEQRETLIKKIKEKHYRIREENGNLLAEKYRFSRWGPYVNHVGLIIVLIGGMLRFVPGMYLDETLWIRDGETSVIPGTNGEYYLNSEGFFLETYDNNQEDQKISESLSGAGNEATIRNYQTNTTLYKIEGQAMPGVNPELKKVKERQIRVNHPLRFDSYSIYQSSYKLNELNKMTFNLVDKQTKEQLGQIEIDLLEPQKTYDMGNGYRVEISEYFPDFYFNSDGQPATQTQSPDNPAFLFRLISPEHPEGETSFTAIQNTLEMSSDNTLRMDFENAETKNLSALRVRKDNTLWILLFGGAVFMIGIIQGMYWNHRRIWIRTTNDEIIIAAHTNKNWYGITKEINKILKDAHIEELADPNTKRK